MAVLASALNSDDHSKSLALLFLDLDDFKRINDTLGHAAGDAVLIEVAARLTATTREPDVVARLGGDEYVVLLRDIDLDVARNRAKDIARAVRQPIWIGERMVALSASVGVSVAVGASAHSDELLRQADAALYRAKEVSRGESVMFEPSWATMDEHHVTTGADGAPTDFLRAVDV